MSGLLLDTHALHWLATGDARLSAVARAAISAHIGNLYVSSISALELALLAHHRNPARRINFKMPVRKWFEGALAWHGVQDIPVRSSLCAEAPSLKLLQADPYDRLIVATALEGGMDLCTKDGPTTMSGVTGLKVIW